MKKIFTITLFLFLVLVIPGSSLLFAQSQISEIQDSIGMQSPQVSDNKIDRLINFMAMIAAVFGIIIAIVIAFFAIRQITVDKEINAYKKEIKEQKDLIVKETIQTKKELQETMSWARDKKDQIDKELKKPTSQKTKKELEKLKEEIEALRRDVAYKRGEVSVFDTSGTITAGGNYLSGGSAYEQIFPNLGKKVCEMCGKEYQDDFSGVSGDRCPRCGHINSRWRL